MKILLATGNLHKKEELSQMLPGIELILPAELNLDMNYEETGDTFRANALGKALHLYKQNDQYPVLADDSGIVVDALDGRPGVYSARYGHTEAKKPGPKEQYELLLKEMAQKQNRSARYVCALVLVHDFYRFDLVQETWEGEIAKEPSGTGGFGYDPIFFLPELSRHSAELTPEEKNKLSHRGKAVQRLFRIIKEDEHVGDT